MNTFVVMNNLSDIKIKTVENLDFGYFDGEFESLPAAIDAAEAQRIVNSDRYIVKQAFHEYRAEFRAGNDQAQAVEASAFLLGTDAQINLFLNVILAAELCGQNLLGPGKKPEINDGRGKTALTGGVE